MAFERKGRIFQKHWQVASVNSDLEAERTLGGSPKFGVSLPVLCTLCAALKLGLSPKVLYTEFTGKGSVGTIFSVGDIKGHLPLLVATFIKMHRALLFQLQLSSLPQSGGVGQKILYSPFI